MRRIRIIAAIAAASIGLFVAAIPGFAETQLFPYYVSIDADGEHFTSQYDVNTLYPGMQVEIVRYEGPSGVAVAYGAGITRLDAATVMQAAADVAASALDVKYGLNLQGFIPAK